MDDWSIRTELLLGPEPVARLTETSVLLVGVGGVGAAAAELLCRAGVGAMTLVDGDTVGESNRNRQLNALVSTIGLKKVEVTAARLKDINPAIRLRLVSEFMDETAMGALLDTEPYDFVVDAIDTLAPKVSLLEGAFRRNMLVVSAMGAGAKMDPTKIQQADISKTHQCALAKAVRHELGKRGIRSGIPVVFSTEPAKKEAILKTSNERNKKSTVGTVSYMPVMFGCHLAAYVIRELGKSVNNEL